MIFSAGTATVTNSDFYNIGDELALGTTGNIAWVCDKGVSTISVINKSGISSGITGTTRIKVLRSGKRNLLSSQMSSLTSLVSPLIDYDNSVPNPKLRLDAASKVLNTSAMEYSDQWQTFKGFSGILPLHVTARMALLGAVRQLI